MLALTKLQHPQGGFFSAADADSQAVDSKFYAWTDQDQELTSMRNRTLAWRPELEQRRIVA
ncbi:MAG: hypothetical protein V7629_09000 [Motiliproteus sp.]